MPGRNNITDAAMRFGAIIVFSVAGLLSGILTAGSLAFLDPLNPFVGATFGFVVALCLSLQQREGSAGRIISLIAASVTAYFVAVWSPLWTTFLLRSVRIVGDSGGLDAFSPAGFSFAGFVGAFFIMLAVLFLFFQEQGWRAPAKAAVLAVPGALLGLVSFTASGPLAALVLNGLDHLRLARHTAGLDTERFYSAYLVWQAGMGFVIAAILPRTAMALSRSGQPVPVTPPPMKLSAGGKTFVLCVLAGTAVLGVFEGRDRYRVWHYQSQAQKAWEQAPSADNLPEVEQRPIEQVLILNEIDGYAESGAKIVRIPAQKTYRGSAGKSGYESRTFAARVLYSVRYQKTKNAIDLTAQPAVDVQVLEYPNSEWARYQLKDVPFQDAKFLYSGSIKTTTKFGNPVLINAIQGSHGAYVYWPSANKTVVLHYYGQEDDEFVRQYLAKYPSAL